MIPHFLFSIPLELCLLLSNAVAPVKAATITTPPLVPRAQATLPPDLIGYTYSSGKCKAHTTDFVYAKEISITKWRRRNMELSLKLGIPNHWVIRTVLFDCKAGLLYGDNMYQWEHHG